MQYVPGESQQAEALLSAGISDRSNEGDFPQAETLSPNDIWVELFLLAGAVFFGMTVLAVDKVFSMPVSPRAVLLVGSLGGLLASYAYRTALTLGFSVLALVIWWVAQAVEWAGSRGTRTVGILGTLAVVSLLLVCLGRLHKGWAWGRRFSPVYSTLGILGSATVVYFLSTTSGMWFVQAMMRGRPTAGSPGILVSLLVALSAMAVAAPTCVALKKLRAGEAWLVGSLAGLFALVSLAPGEPVLLEGDPFGPGTASLSVTGAGIAWAVAFNALVLVLVVALMLDAYVAGKPGQVNAGSVLLFVLIVSKYFEQTYTRLDTSLFFIGAGLVLIGVGGLTEWTRRRMLSRIRSETGEGAGPSSGEGRREP